MIVKPNADVVFSYKVNLDELDKYLSEKLCQALAEFDTGAKINPKRTLFDYTLSEVKL